MLIWNPLTPPRTTPSGGASGSAASPRTPDLGPWLSRRVCPERNVPGLHLCVKTLVGSLRFLGVTAGRRRAVTP